MVNLFIARSVLKNPNIPDADGIYSLSFHLLKNNSISLSKIKYNPNFEFVKQLVKLNIFQIWANTHPPENDVFTAQSGAHK